jgi:hypothetical protein
MPKSQKLHVKVGDVVTVSFQVFIKMKLVKL